MLALGVDGAIDLSAVMPSGATDLVIDVSGFFGQYSSAAFGSTLLYAGAGAALFGAVAAVRPLPRLGLGRRRLGLLLLAAGVAMGVAAVLLPAPTRVSAASGSLLDAAMPEYQFREFHALRVEAPPERAWAAIRAVTADEIRLFRLLTWLRNPRLPGRSAPESILAPPAAKPILEVALGSGFFTLAEDAPRELVIGAYVVAPAAASRLSPAALRRATEPLVFTALDQPGFAKAAMNFRLLDLGGGASLLTTETRVVATDAATRRRFGAYWRAIYPGSALIRRMWLRAIRDRAALEPAA